MNKDLMEVFGDLAREREISEDIIFEVITTSLINACKNQYKSADNISVEIDHDTYEYHVIAEKEVIELEEDVMDPAIEISLEEAKKIDPNAEVGKTVNVEIDTKQLGRIATQTARNVFTQKLREEERNVIYNQFHAKEKTVVTGVVQRRSGRSWHIDLGKTEAILAESEMIPNETLRPNERIKVFILEVRPAAKGSKIMVSRTHPDLVKRLFEAEVTEIQDGTVEIMSIAREPGSRTKMAVYSKDPNVDPVGACVGVKGDRAKTIVKELKGERVDIICWDENPGNLIRNALSPAEIVNVFADPEEKTANVVVPDAQLSLAIGKSGQNARLAAKLTNYKIDIKSETQAKDAYGFRIEDYMEDDLDEYDDEYDSYEDDENYDDSYMDAESEEYKEYLDSEDSGDEEE